MRTINFKKIISCLTVFVLAAGVFLYVDAKNKPATVKKAVATGTWYYTGSGSPLDPESYSDQQDPNKPCGFPFETICTIEAPDDGGHPNLDEEVYDPVTEQDQTIGFLIERAMASLSSTPETNAAVSAFRAN